MPANDAQLHGFHERGYLPHLKREGADYFVTFRLADSLPREALDRLEVELAVLSLPETLSPQTAETEKQKLRRRRIEGLLDAGTGACHLAHPAIAALISDALRHFHGARYDLEAWAVMPNHIHVLVRPRAPHALGEIIKSWKQYTSTHAKRMLGLPPGRFWQPECYDHWVRDGEDRGRIIRYIHNNPVKAGLCARPEDWRWSSAHQSSAGFQPASDSAHKAG
jgi:REP element-mobilizing transposase RayT